MKNFIFIFAMAYPFIAYSYMLLPIIEVYDGDTIKSDMSARLPDPLGDISIRVSGIDTPEMPAKSYHETGKLNRAKCVQEAELALEAKEFVEMMAVGFKKMKVDNFDWGKYGGRIVGDVKIGGVDVATALINEGLAVPYDGKTAKSHDWCE
jgi:endonuclease YncB( thermonuclease family)